MELQAAADAPKYRERNSRLFAFWRSKGFISDGMKVLDFGAGGGHIPIQLREEMPSVSIDCAETDERSCAWLRENGLRVVSEPEGPYDAAYMVEVLEHLDDPVWTLRFIRHSLRGKLFLSTPAGEVRFGVRKTKAYDTPEHIHFFTPASLRLALVSAGFSEVRFMVVNAMYPERRPVVAALRYVRAALLGNPHLVVLAS